MPPNNTINATTNNNGNAGYDGSASLNNGGSNGSGGTPGDVASRAGSGSGFTGNGSISFDVRPGPNVDAQSFLNGGVGGLIVSQYTDGLNTQGGFGGGGCGGWGGAGGGGGYSGGGDGGLNGAGGGGGSINNGTNKSNMGGLHDEDGRVLITLITEAYLNSPLYIFTSHTFTNCGASGRFGPSLSNCRTSYNYLPSLNYKKYDN
jgi:hypothetical protein